MNWYMSKADNDDDKKISFFKSYKKIYFIHKQIDKFTIQKKNCGFIFIFGKIYNKHIHDLKKKN